MHFVELFLPPPTLAVCSPYSTAIFRVSPTLLRANCTSEVLPTFSQAATVPSPRRMAVRDVEKEGYRASALSFPMPIPKCASVPQLGTLGGLCSSPPPKLELASWCREHPCFAPAHADRVPASEVRGCGKRGPWAVGSRTLSPCG